MNNIFIPTKNSVWLGVRIIQSLGRNPFSCPVEHMAWNNYRYSADQRENGALAGELVDSRNGKLLAVSDDNLTTLLQAEKLEVIGSNGYDVFDRTIRIKE
jgi:hypothetical protein